MEARFAPPGATRDRIQQHRALAGAVKRGILESLAFVFALAILLSQWPLAFGDTYHLLAAQMVAAGRKPYLDFFVQQVPLYPLICGAWLRIFGSSWQAANLFSGLLICGSAAIVARIASRIYAGTEWGAKCSMIAVLLFGLNLLVAQSGDDAQPYALCMFFCLAAWLAALDARPTTRRIFMTGLAAGAAVNTSLLAAPFFLILMVWCVVQAEGSPAPQIVVARLRSGGGVDSFGDIGDASAEQAWFSIVKFQLFYRTAAHAAEKYCIPQPARNPGLGAFDPGRSPAFVEPGWFAISFRPQGAQAGAPFDWLRRVDRSHMGALLGVCAVQPGTCISFWWFRTLACWPRRDWASCAPERGCRDGRPKSWRARYCFIPWGSPSRWWRA